MGELFLNDFSLSPPSRSLEQAISDGQGKRSRHFVTNQNFAFHESRNKIYCVTPFENRSRAKSYKSYGTTTSSIL